MKLSAKEAAPFWPYLFDGFKMIGGAAVRNFEYQSLTSECIQISGIECGLLYFTRTNPELFKKLSYKPNPEQLKVLDRIKQKLTQSKKD